MDKNNFVRADGQGIGYDFDRNDLIFNDFSPIYINIPKFIYACPFICLYFKASHFSVS